MKIFYSSSLITVALLGAGVTSASVSGCGSDIPWAFPNPGRSKSLHLPNSDREYRLHIPTNYDKDKPTPLYFSFHGATRDMNEQESLSQFSNPEFNPNGIAIYPNGRNGLWLSNPNADTSRPNDLDFVNELLTHMEEKLCIDPRRVYAAGKSNGGGFTSVLACNATVGRRFAAFAAVSGAYYDTDQTPGVGPCAPARRDEGYPFLEFHGTVDVTAPIDGNTEKHPKLPVIDILEGWAERNGCGVNARWARNETVFENPLVKHASWDCQGKNGIVQHYREGENGHCWPSTVSNDDFVNQGSRCPLGKYVFNATEYIFDFFGQYQLNP
ncbi:Feruloyl esterase [Penicillium ucsense]|uniref:feruloyl esterase n=1 Tax=Penicillium ucsense TaxID=2839758 RepID=A0A8J8WHZ6_9EURO|nr:Feruloyl esterase [Penicillium ucsense]KAF7738883.1 Feruloyl esterase [Penicillium ucsense]